MDQEAEADEQKGDLVAPRDAQREGEQQGSEHRHAVEQERVEGRNRSQSLSGDQHSSGSDRRRPEPDLAGSQRAGERGRPCQDRGDRNQPKRRVQNLGGDGDEPKQHGLELPEVRRMRAHRFDEGIARQEGGIQFPQQPGQMDRVISGTKKVTIRADR
jgi:hypothetical protein